MKKPIKWFVVSPKEMGNLCDRKKSLDQAKQSTVSPVVIGSVYAIMEKKLKIEFSCQTQTIILSPNKWGSLLYPLK